MGELPLKGTLNNRKNGSSLGVFFLSLGHCHQTVPKEAVEEQPTAGASGCSHSTRGRLHISLLKLPALSALQSFHSEAFVFITSNIFLLPLLALICECVLNYQNSDRWPHCSCRAWRDRSCSQRETLQRQGCGCPDRVPLPGH